MPRSSPPPQPKKPYTSPILEEFGDLARITKGNGGGKFDNGKNASNGKTNG